MSVENIGNSALGEGGGLLSTEICCKMYKSLRWPCRLRAYRFVDGALYKKYRGIGFAMLHEADVASMFAYGLFLSRCTFNILFNAV